MSRPPAPRGRPQEQSAAPKSRSLRLLRVIRRIDKRAVGWSPTTTLVVKTLVEHVNERMTDKQGRLLSFPGVTCVSIETGLHERTVRDQYDEIEKLGICDVERPKGRSIRFWFDLDCLDQLPKYLSPWEADDDDSEPRVHDPGFEDQAQKEPRADDPGFQEGTPGPGSGTPGRGPRNPGSSIQEPRVVGPPNSGRTSAVNSEQNLQEEKEAPGPGSAVDAPAPPPPPSGRAELTVEQAFAIADEEAARRGRPRPQRDRRPVRQLIEEATQASASSPDCAPSDALRARLREHFEREDEYLRDRGWPLGLALQVPQPVPEVRDQTTPWRENQRQVLRALCVGALVVSADIIRTETRDAPLEDEEDVEIVNGLRCVNSAARRARELIAAVPDDGTSVEASELIERFLRQRPMDRDDATRLLDNVVSHGDLARDGDGRIRRVAS